MSVPPTIGVLALQGDVREHMAMLQRCDAHAVPVRRAEELLAVDGLIVPGGESTTMIKLAASFEVLEPLRKRVSEQMPTYGTCAGMILLADRIEDGVDDQPTIGGIDMVVRRNAFGRQVDSFEVDVNVGPLAAPFHATFIRAPWVEQVGAGCEVLARVASGSALGRIVAVRQQNLLATAFHPELGGDPRMHELFVRCVKEA